jgi:hypothetical protein
MPTYLLEDRSTIPEDGQTDQTAARATKLDKALEQARELAKGAARKHGRGRGIVYVWEEGTQHVWSVQYHPEPGVAGGGEPELDEDGRPVLDDDGEPVTRGGRTYPVGWRIVHDASERAVEWGADDLGRKVVASEEWAGGIEVTDYDEAGNRIDVNDQATGATRAVTHVEVTRG